MADNFTTKNASDATITGAADDIGSGVLAPFVKLLDGTDGSSTPVGTATNPLRTDPTGTTTQPVSAAALPLPTGAATSANQATANASLDSIDTKLTGVAADGTDVTGASMPAGGAGIRGWLSALYTALVARLPVLTLVSGALKVDGSAVTQPVSGTVTANLGTIGGAATESTLAGVLTAVGSPLQEGGSIGNTAFGATQSGTWTVQPGNTANTTPWLVSEQAKTSGGATPYKLNSAATTNATSVKASAGQLYMVTASNTNAAVRYLKLYDKASTPTVGTDTPVLAFAVPGNTAGAGTNIPVPPCGLQFANGIAFALTTGAADSDTAAVAANEIVVNLGYK